MILTIGPQRALFERLIDYAGLFPPESLGMRDAVAGYRRARSSPAAWMAGHFLCPSSRLEELATELTATMTAGEAAWSVSAVFDQDPGPAAAAAAAFHREMDPAAVIALAEATIPLQALGSDPQTSVSGLFAAITSIGPHVVLYVETPRSESWQGDMPQAMAAIDRARAAAGRQGGAKLRCGGARTTDIPTAEQVASFLSACAAHRLPFKATAGLHHPVRHYDTGRGAMSHGFLNLLAAAALVAEGENVEVVVAAISEVDADGFSVSAAGFRWRDRRIPNSTIAAMRHQLFPSYGSCSFDEPVGDLGHLGFLPLPANR